MGSIPTQVLRFFLQKKILGLVYKCYWFVYRISLLFIKKDIIHGKCYALPSAVILKLVIKVCMAKPKLNSIVTCMGQNRLP